MLKRFFNFNEDDWISQLEADSDEMLAQSDAEHTCNNGRRSCFRSGNIRISKKLEKIMLVREIQNYSLENDILSSGGGTKTISSNDDVLQNDLNAVPLQENTLTSFRDEPRNEFSEYIKEPDNITVQPEEIKQTSLPVNDLNFSEPIGTGEALDQGREVDIVSGKSDTIIKQTSLPVNDLNFNEPIHYQHYTDGEIEKTPQIIEPIP